jgi:hypothetical protein
VNEIHVGEYVVREQFEPGERALAQAVVAVVINPEWIGVLHTGFMDPYGAASPQWRVFEGPVTVDGDTYRVPRLTVRLSEPVPRDLRHYVDGLTRAAEERGLTRDQLVRDAVDLCLCDYGHRDEDEAEDELEDDDDGDRKRPDQ